MSSDESRIMNRASGDGPANRGVRFGDQATKTRRRQRSCDAPVDDATKSDANGADDENGKTRHYSKVVTITPGNGNTRRHRDSDVITSARRVTSDVTGTSLQHTTPKITRDHDVTGRTPGTMSALELSLSGREKVTGHAVPSGAVDPAGPMTCRAGVCNKRLLGEIALQLDTRILHYIFTPTQPRSSNSNQPPHPHPHHDVTPATGGGRPHELYGFLVKDIPRLIEQDCAQYSHGDSDSGQVVDTARRYQLMYRYKYLAHSLRPFGYDFHFHPHFAARLLNRYGGLLSAVHQNRRSEANSFTCGTPSSSLNASRQHHFLMTLGPESRAQLCDVINAVAPPVELQDCLVLLNCLVLLASDDARPLFL